MYESGLVMWDLVFYDDTPGILASNPYILSRDGRQVERIRVYHPATGNTVICDTSDLVTANDYRTAGIKELEESR